MDNNLFTPPQLAKRLQIGVRTLYRLVDQGMVPRPVKFGHNVRFLENDIQAWLSAGCPRCRTAPAGRGVTHG